MGLVFLVDGGEAEQLAYALWKDVEDRWPGKTFTEDEKTFATTLLEDAAVLIDTDYPLPDPATAHDLRVRKIVSVDMVTRRMQPNAGGIFGAVPGDPTSAQVSVGPFQRSFGGMSAPMGSLSLLRSDRDKLRGKRQRAFSIDLLGYLDEPEGS